MKIILDTSVLSEIRNPKGHQQVKERFNQIDDEAMYISVITLGEIAYGVHLLPEGKKKEALKNWVQQVHLIYRERLHEIDDNTALIWADVTAQAKKKGHNVSTNDAFIAASSIQYNMPIFTLNTKDFKPLGVKLVPLK